MTHAAARRAAHPAARAAVVALVLALAAGLALHACGDNGGRTKRQRVQCDSCDPTEIDQDCVRECLRFCPAGQDCTDRCNVECDRCKSELECRPCSADCTGTVARCAPVDAPVTCEDGQF